MSKEKRNTNIYGIYDIKNFEQCVTIGTMKEIANFLNCSSNSIRSYMSHKKQKKRFLIHKRYDVIKIIDDKEENRTKTDVN